VFVVWKIKNPLQTGAKYMLTQAAIQFYITMIGIYHFCFAEKAARRYHRAVFLPHTKILCER